MTQEEKAAVYDKALEKYINYVLPISKLFTNVLLDLFPEFRESPGERIRKAHIDTIKFWRSVMESPYMLGISKEEVRAWLEKQGKQESVVVIPKFRVGDVIRPKGSMAEYTIESISGGCYHGKGWGLNISSDDDYELVEQKSSWSKEDENMLNHIISIIENADDDLIRAENISIYTNWLKSRMQPQLKWKPSELQIEALESATANCAYSEYQDCLRELIGQLKKLTEE